MKVLVLGGGDSPEREVSLRSAKAVAEAARQAGLSVKEADPELGFDFLDDVENGTIIFPILHGKGGEDGSIQTELEKRQLPYLGSDSKSSARCFDKWATRMALSPLGIPLPEGSLVTEELYPDNPLAKRPHVLKVVHGGSSIGTLIARNPEAINQEETDRIFKMENQAVIEELIEGTEVTVPILDRQALTPIEIRPPSGLEFDYENKYNGQTQELCPPGTVPENVQEQVKELAERVHKTMNCRHLSRVDIVLDKQNQPHVLEINTMPGMTGQSLFPKAAAVAGMSMSDLVLFFTELVKRDYNL